MATVAKNLIPKELRARVHGLRDASQLGTKTERSTMEIAEAQQMLTYE